MLLRLIPIPTSANGDADLCLGKAALLHAGLTSNILEPGHRDGGVMGVYASRRQVT